MKTQLIITLALSACLVTLAGSATADAEPQVEQGRLQVCKTRMTFGEQGTIELPVDGKYLVPAAKAGTKEDLIITQTDFSAAQAAVDRPQRATMLQRDGASWLRIDLKGQNCTYLHAAAPALNRPGVTLSGTVVLPDWHPTDAGLTFRYLNSLDRTLYIASEIGKEISFITHDFSTGSNLSHDQNLRVANTNRDAQNMVPEAIKAVMPAVGQFDVDPVDTESYGLSIKGLDTESAGDVKKLVAAFVTAVQPTAHSQLLLALPARGTVNMKFSNTTLVGNKFEGIGYYRDSTLRVIYDSNHNDYVPIVAFINFRLVLIDLDTASVVAERKESYGHILYRPPFQVDDPMNSIDQYASITSLEAVIAQGTRNAAEVIFHTK